MDKRVTFAQMVYTEIKRRILSKEYGVNDYISEKSIAAQLGVSKTPAREALRKLCLEGYLLSYPNMGYVIKDLNYKEIRNISELRFILESAALRISARYSSDDDIRRLYEYADVSENNVIDGYGKNAIFHWELGKLTKNDYLSDTIRHYAMSVFRPSSYTEVDDKQKPGAYKHLKIVEALEKRDTESAIEFLKADILFGEHREF